MARNDNAKILGRVPSRGGISPPKGFLISKNVFCKKISVRGIEYHGGYLVVPGFAFPGPENIQARAGVQWGDRVVKGYCWQECSAGAGVAHGTLTVHQW